RACGARAVVARDDGGSRDFELLPRRTEVLFGTGPMTAAYHEGQLELRVDLLEDHKTGGYLDQRENHLRAGELARGEALDAFCYHGGFALQLARGADRVLAIDQDASAVVLVTGGCAGKVSPELFGEVIEWASQEAKRPLQLLERRGAARDHPPLLGVPETDYLKCWFLLAP